MIDFRSDTGVAAHIGCTPLATANAERTSARV